MVQQKWSPRVASWPRQMVFVLDVSKILQGGFLTNSCGPLILYVSRMSWSFSIFLILVVPNKIKQFKCSTW